VLYPSFLPRARRALNEKLLTTHGESYFLRSINEAEEICRKQRWNKEKVLHDLENTTLISSLDYYGHDEVSCAERKKISAAAT